MEIHDPNEESISFSAYGGNDAYVQWRKPTKEEAERVRELYSEDFANKVLSGLWVKHSDELPSEKAKHIEYQMTPEEREEDRKWWEHADALCNIELHLKMLKGKPAMEKITYLENLLNEFNTLPPCPKVREARKVYNDYLNNEKSNLEKV